MVPGVKTKVKIPTRAEKLATGKHNAYAMIAAKVAMVYQHKTYGPLKFARGNRQRYNLMPRQVIYDHIKQTQVGHSIDLVRTGATKRMYLQPITPLVRIVSGKVIANFQVGLSWKDPLAKNKWAQYKRPIVTRQVILSELGRWADEEVTASLKSYSEAYWKQVVRMPANTTTAR